MIKRPLFLLPVGVLVTVTACTPTGPASRPTSTFSPPPSATATASATVSLPPGSPPALHQVHDPGQVTGTLTGPCHAQDNGQLPDPSCTPGAYDPAITAAVLCAPGYMTSSYRPPSSQTSALKYNVIEPAYGENNVKGELDHLVSLELGGANDTSNLWVEPGPIPNAKDTIENTLHAWVCLASGAAAQLRLNAAQIAIAADWLTAETTLGVTG